MQLQAKPVRVCVGSTNENKINAVRETIRNYDFLAGADVVAANVNSGVAEQPKSINETIRGAMNRAKAAFSSCKDCNYGFGLEDGLMEVANTKTDYMNVGACAIYDGKNFHIGLSSAYEYPHEVTRLVVEEGLDINQAFFKAGLTKNPKIGNAEGAVSILTHGRVNRKEYAKQSIVMALIHLENSHLF